MIRIFPGHNVILALTLTGASLAQAGMPEAGSFGELERAGYVPLDLLTTPLLYPVATGKPYDARTLLLQGRNSLPADLKKRSRELDHRDEFKVHHALQAFKPHLEDRTTALRQARGYLVGVRYSLGEYDFEHRRFPLKLQLQVAKPRSSDSYHCSGAYDKIRNTLLSACVGPTNWNGKHPAFQYLAIDDIEQAQLIKQRLAQEKAGFFFVMQPDGPFRTDQSGKMRFGMINQTIVSGVQPARVLGLLLVDLETDEILISGPIPEAAPER